MSSHDVVDDLIVGFHERTPPRIWSLIVTLFGDLIMPRGGIVGLSTLSTLCDLMAVGGSALRPAMSRLTADGLLEREKHGRNTFYRLSPSTTEEFARVSIQIYALEPPAWDGRWSVAIRSSGSPEDRASARVWLQANRFGSIGSDAFLRPHTRGLGQSPKTISLLVSAPEMSEALPDGLIAGCWPLKLVGDNYRIFLSRYASLDKTCAAMDSLAPDRAIIARSLLIHDYRRVVLTDPTLPAELLPNDWPGQEARALAARVYHALTAPSEHWLDEHGQTPAGPLPPLSVKFRERFQASNEP